MLRQGGPRGRGAAGTRPEEGGARPGVQAVHGAQCVKPRLRCTRTGCRGAAAPGVGSLAVTEMIALIVQFPRIQLSTAPARCTFSEGGQHVDITTYPWYAREHRLIRASKSCPPGSSGRLLGGPRLQRPHLLRNPAPGDFHSAGRQMCPSALSCCCLWIPRRRGQRLRQQRVGDNQKCTSEYVTTQDSCSQGNQ